MSLIGPSRRFAAMHWLVGFRGKADFACRRPERMLAECLMMIGARLIG